mmetsp:Transcript_5073/g.8639  ORF Transcript_5073/g.8639 Transcript_5073/m.8639 type:complete len:84 (-) Transcript_5073:269-520(-)|eukprot:scaffold3515_cov216-Skeletonema_menzelii.AAC.2
MEEEGPRHMVMLEKYPDLFENPSKMMWAISFYHSRGAQDVLDGNMKMKQAQHAAICAEAFAYVRSCCADRWRIDRWKTIRHNA